MDDKPTNLIPWDVLAAVGVRCCKCIMLPPCHHASVGIDGSQQLKVVAIFRGRHIAVLLAYVHSTTRLLDYIFFFNVLCCQEFQGCVFNLGISRTFNASSLAQPEPVCIINCPSCHPLLSFSLLTSIAQLQI